MLLLTTLIFETNHDLAGIDFIFLKKRYKQTWMTSDTTFGPQWKEGESSYQVRQISVLFCKLVVLTLG